MAHKLEVHVRAQTVYALHSQGLNYVQIADKFKITRERVRQLVNLAIRLQAIDQLPPPAPQELSVRVYNSLVNDGIEEVTPKAVHDAYGTVEELKRVPGFGKNGILELQNWLIWRGAKPLP